MAEMLRATEAAVVSDTPLREVNRTVDEHILPAGSYSVGRVRRFSPSACMMIAFYHASADDLTKIKRTHFINKVGPRLQHLTIQTIQSRLQEDWSLKDGFVTIDFAPFMERALHRLEQLREANEMVARSIDVMGGVPVIRRTRVPVHDVGASVKAGYSMERIRGAYPGLNDRQIQLAALYAEANPPKGRPRASSKLPDTTIISERRTTRRRKTG